MAINLSGLLLPVTTPFNSNQEINQPGLVSNLEKWNEAGVTGYLVLGSTGERVNLDEREYFQVIEVTRCAIPKTSTFIVGAGQQSTRGTISEIRRAASAGADAVLVITPNYYRSAITQQALIEHYTAAADSSPVPVILYSMPDLTGVRIEPETTARLSRHQNIIAMKDSSGDVEQFAAAVRLAAEGFAMVIGNGTVFAPALQAGACGGILAVGLAVPDICLEIYRAFVSGNLTEAVTLQEKLTPLARAVTKTYGIGGLKAAMDMAGYAGGAARTPLPTPSAAGLAEIEQLLRAVSEPRAIATG